MSPAGRLSGKTAGCPPQGLRRSVYPARLPRAPCTLWSSVPMRKDPGTLTRHCPRAAASGDPTARKQPCSLGPQGDSRGRLTSSTTRASSLSCPGTVLPARCSHPCHPLLTPKSPGSPNTLLPERSPQTSHADALPSGDRVFTRLSPVGFWALSRQLPQAVAVLTTLCRLSLQLDPPRGQQPCPVPAVWHAVVAQKYLTTQSLT